MINGVEVTQVIVDESASMSPDMWWNNPPINVSKLYTVKNSDSDSDSDSDTGTWVTDNHFNIKDSIPKNRQILNRFDERLVNRGDEFPKSKNECLDLVGKRIVKWFIKPTFNYIVRTGHLEDKNLKFFEDTSLLKSVGQIYAVSLPFIVGNKVYPPHILYSTVVPRNRIIHSNGTMLLSDFATAYEIKIREHIEMLLRFSPNKLLLQLSENSYLPESDHILNRAYDGYMNHTKSHIGEFLYD